MNREGVSDVSVDISEADEVAVKILTIEDINLAIDGGDIVLRGCITADVLTSFVKVSGGWPVYSDLTREQMFECIVVTLSDELKSLNLDEVSGLSAAMMEIKEKAVRFRENYNKFARACDEVVSSVVNCGGSVCVRE